MPLADPATRPSRRRFTAVPASFGGNALLAIMLFTFIDNLLRVLPVGRRADHSVFAVKDFGWLQRRRLFLRV